DIAMLVEYAHMFGVKVYVAINTIIYDEEIPAVERLVRDLSSAKVDALIVQDMAFAEMDIPPIALFASTQTTNLTAERVRFLQNVGFERVILERALSLDDIREIRDVTNVDLECFIHGAICVSYSGNCYMSMAVAGRSANRGVCAQPCRSTYNLLNERGDFIMRGKHLLSLKDLSLEHSLSDLADAGVTSFKIEGRLKDDVYLKNSVAYYSNKLDDCIKNSGGRFCRASHGKSVSSFIPNLYKSFSRSFTPYFINGKIADVASLHTAKSVGQYVGEVLAVDHNGFVLKDTPLCRLTSGDGICFINADGDFSGTYVNRVSDRRITTAKIDGISENSKIYRNFDKQFVDTVSGKSVERKIDAHIQIADSKITFITAAVECSVGFDYEPAQNIEKATNGLKANMAKCGDSIFNIISVEITTDVPFLPISKQNELRRELFTMAQHKIIDGYIVKQGTKLKPASYGSEKVDYKANVANSLAEKFYRACGAKEIEKAVELTSSFEGVELMRMSYCIGKELGRCLKEGAKAENLYIENNGRVFRLRFDCKHCQMVIEKK
ncbi:MAG: U32 family peptidase, partial [Rikenellaceae bacterium]